MRVFTRVKYRSGVNMLDLCVEYVHHAYICYCSLFEKKKKVAHNKLFMAVPEQRKGTEVSRGQHQLKW